MSKRDYYEVLGVGKDAGESDIKGAYRKLALKHHPDRNPDDPSAEERFKEASEAYSVLSDPQKRAAYDRFGHAGLQGAAGSGGFSPDAFADFSDILGDFFGFSDLFGGGGRRRSRAQRGEDVRYDLEIEFEEAVFGMGAKIQVPKMEVCDRCQGSGAEPGSGASHVPHVPRPRGDDLPAELPFDPQDLQHVRRLGTGGSQPLQPVPRPPLPAGAEGAQGQHPRGCR